jgi:hypothetical protein
VSTTEGLLGRKSSGSGLASRDYVTSQKVEVFRFNFALSPTACLWPYFLRVLSTPAQLLCTVVPLSCIKAALLKAHPKYSVLLKLIDRLCGLVVGVLGYRSGGPGLIPGTTKKK